MLSHALYTGVRRGLTTRAHSLGLPKFRDSRGPGPYLLDRSADTRQPVPSQRDQQAKSRGGKIRKAFAHDRSYGHEDVCGSAKAGEINGAGQHYCISTFPDRPCPTAHSCYGGDCGRQRVTPIQIDWNLVEGIVAGKSRGIKLKTDILPGQAERIENSPSGRNCGEWDSY